MYTFVNVPYWDVYTHTHTVTHSLVVSHSEGLVETTNPSAVTNATVAVAMATEE